MQEKSISPLAFHNLKNLNIEVSAFTQPDMTYDEFGSGDDELAARNIRPRFSTYLLPVLKGK